MQASGLFKSACRRVDNNMKWLRLGVVLVCLLAFSVSLAYAKTDFINEISRLYDAGQRGEAYALAEQHLLEAEGDPLFDYYYGLLAIDSGHLDQGVFALERVLMFRPNYHRVRLELARGYFLLEQYDRARQEFTKVLDANPPAEVKENIKQFMDIIRLREAGYKTTVNMYAEAGTGYDTNVNSSPSAANFSSPTLGPGTLSGTSVAIKDSYYNTAFGVSVMHPVKPGVFLFGDASTTYKSFEDTPDFNLRSVDLRGGLILSNDKTRLKIGLQWQDFEVGHDRYREMSAINSDIRWQLNDQTMLTGFAQLADMNFLTNKSRDSWQQMAGVGFQRLFSMRYRPVLFASLYGGAERSRQDTAVAEELVDRDIYGFNIGTQLTITQKLSLSFVMALQESRYRIEDSIFLIKREDEYRNFSIKGAWKLCKQWAVGANLGYTENDSNISINRYYRTQAGMTIRYDY